MANETRTSELHGFNKGRSSKFRVGSLVRQTPEEGRRTYRPKRYGNNNKDEDNSPKTLNDKSHQASSQKFRHLIPSICQIFWKFVHLTRIKKKLLHAKGLNKNNYSVIKKWIRGCELTLFNLSSTALAVTWYAWSSTTCPFFAKVTI